MSNEQKNRGLFLPTNYIWDMQDINDIDVTSDNFKELLIRLYQNINSMCLAINLKDSGYYFPQEFVNGQVLFPNPNKNKKSSRQIFRNVVNFGALPLASSQSIPHGININGSYSFTRIYAVASNPIDLSYLPIPYASATLINNIELKVDDTNVTIITAADYSMYTICYVVLEYVKE